MRETDRSPESLDRQVRPPSRDTSTFGLVGQGPVTARQARVAELTASIRFTGADVAVGDGVLDGSGEAVLDVVGSGLFDVGVALGELRVAAGTGRFAEGSTAETASAASERDLSSITSKIIKTALIKTNPPMASFGQWPFEMSGMRGSLAAKLWAETTTGQRPFREAQ
jgi:hypothetical protein